MIAAPCVDLGRSGRNAAPARRRCGANEGYAMAALLVAMSIMAVALSVALPVWNTYARREREAELVFRGEQYARAIGLFQRKYANTLPPNLDVLINERFLRKKYTDPITGGEFQLISGAGGQGAPGMAPGAGGGTQSRTGGAAGMSQAGGSGAGSSTRPGQSTFSLGQSGATQAGPGRTGSSFGGAAAGGIMGVVSKSTDKSLRLYFGRGAYNEWSFVAVQREIQAGGPPGSQAPGAGGRRGSQFPGGGGGMQPGGAGGRRSGGTLPSLPPPPFGTPRRGQ